MTQDEWLVALAALSPTLRTLVVSNELNGYISDTAAGGGNGSSIVMQSLEKLAILGKCAYGMFDLVFHSLVMPRLTELTVEEYDKWSKATGTASIGTARVETGELVEAFVSARNNLSIRRAHYLVHLYATF